MKNICRTRILRSWINPLALAFAASLLCSCAPIASVDDVAPTFPAALSQPSASPELKKARALAISATALIESNPKEAMAESETAADLSLKAMKSLPAAKKDQAIALYNYSVARLVEASVNSGEKPWEKAVRLDGPSGRINITLKDLSAGAWIPKCDTLIACDRMQVGGTYFTERVRIDGVGEPFVSKGPGRGEPWTTDKHYYGVTAVARISGHDCTVEICDPLLKPNTTLAGESRVVAADLSAPFALGIVENKPQNFGISALLRTDRYMQAAKLMMVEPYRPDRRPLILVHGLMDSPISWTLLVNALNASPEIRAKYQIWVFRYPSGLPFPLSASLLRKDLAAVYEKYPATPKAILVGHSMGGLLTHMLMCDSGDKFCDDVLGKPLDQFEVEPEQMATLKSSLYFKTSPYVAGAIFMATPHRGANMASNPLGRLGAALVKLPVNLVMLGPKMVSRMTETKGEKLIRRFPNSIDTLRPSARVVKALNDLTIAPTIPYYSIIGDRGRGDTPNSSDGVVAYSSSHLDGAKSELIVPWSHEVQKNSQAIAEVRRILLANW